MTRDEAAKLLAIIKVAYPAAYKDMDRESALATVNMWWHTFPEVPYAVMEMAFERFRRVSKFPPTVAEMIEEIKNIYFSAMLDARLAKSMGDEETYRKCRYIMNGAGAMLGSGQTEIDYNRISEDMLLTDTKLIE